MDSRYGCWGEVDTGDTVTWRARKGEYLTDTVVGWENDLSCVDSEGNWVIWPVFSDGLSMPVYASDGVVITR